MIPGILIGVALLGGAALAFSAIRGGNPRVQHAWSEAPLPHAQHVGGLLGLAEARPLS